MKTVSTAANIKMPTRVLLISVNSSCKGISPFLWNTVTTNPKKIEIALVCVKAAIARKDRDANDTR